MLDWDGVPIVSVSLATARALAAATMPRYGGEMVEELVTIETRNEPEMVYRWSTGYAIEMCSHGAYVHRIGCPLDTVLIDLDLVARAGGEWADEHAIVRQTRADEATRLITPAEVDAIFDELNLDHLDALSSLMPPANMNGVSL